ncbi:purine-cytosine permease family protein [Roseateles saccharophilus]|uniref:Purine-cytosine permease-like protein n=1 Tax=Roseateles saccharophilus TaxID=304 RepID=A0A4R3VK62_ROSSA|nr:cytosine permease [Roseateles saccharophilus]MDG0832921.1 cytosine permease [Roseateles saccharophilus]TCV04593.1 purine-cytosine permease-like protein [Roseateles saccharophilus]
MGTQITQVEQFGFERIPDESRYARPIDLFRLLFGGCNTFSTSVLGALPVLLGLPFWAGAASILLGVAVGTCVLAPMSLFGARNGTNDPVSSGAHFGIHGRIIGSFLALLTSIAFFSLAVWSSGDALVGGAHEMVGLPVNGLTLSCAYGLFAVLVLTVCIYGFRFMLWVNKVAVWTASLLFAMGIFAFAGTLETGYAGRLQTGHAGFWPAFLAATLVALSNPLSFASTLGDWARYIPEHTPRRRLIGAVFVAQVATLAPFLFGLATATIIATKAPQFIASGDYIGGLLAVSPRWFLLPTCLIAIIGGISTGTTALYGTGLDVSSILPRLFNRVRATLAIGTLASVFIFVGRFAFNLVESVSTFATLIVTFSCPWVAIMVIGYATRRGHYLADDLQVFNRGLRGGHYWFTGGWNLRAMGAWVASATTGLLFANVPGEYAGPLSVFTGGFDVSVPVSLAMGGLLYPALLWIFPEPDTVYGPRGRRFVRAPAAAARQAPCPSAAAM